MTTEFDDSEHWGFFLTNQKLTSETGKYVRMSSLVLAALRSAGVFSTMEDGLAAPATDKLWLDKNFDPPVLKEWDATGASWVPMTYGRLFGQAAVGLLSITGGSANAVVISAPAGFQANRLYLITPTATNTGATTIQVSGVGTYNVKYGDGSDIVAGELTAARQTVLLFDGVKFVVILAVGASGVPDGSITTPKLADGALAATPEGRAKMADGFLSADATGRAKVADEFVNTAKLASGALSADATGRGKMADGFLSADTTGRAKMADGFLTAVKAAADFVFGQTAKTAPVDADAVLISDSAASNVPKKLTFANLKAWVRTFLPLTTYTESAEQTITLSGALTLAHGLGVEPKFVQFYLICKTAELGYSVGNKVPWGTQIFTNTVASSTGFTSVIDATNISVRFAAGGFVIPNFTTGTYAAITNGNWRLIARATA